MSKDKKIPQPHPSFYRAMSDVSYSLSVAIGFCPDESIINELIAAHKHLGDLFDSLMSKVNSDVES